MSKKDPFKKELRPALAASSIGIVLVISTLIGVAAGMWLDKKLGTSPWLTVFFTCIGVASGVRNMYIFIKRSGVMDEIPPETYKDYKYIEDDKKDDNKDDDKDDFDNEDKN